MKFRQRPVVIDATQFLGEHSMPELELSMLDSDTEWICQSCGRLASKHGNVSTPEGFMIACPNDWIITGVKGGHYPIKPDSFEAMYEKLGESATTDSTKGGMTFGYKISAYYKKLTVWYFYRSGELSHTEVFTPNKELTIHERELRLKAKIQKIKLAVVDTNANRPKVAD